MDYEKDQREGYRIGASNAVLVLVLIALIGASVKFCSR